MDTGLEMMEHDWTAEGRHFLACGSGVLAAVTELQQYLCVDPAGEDEIDQATATMHVGSAAMSMASPDAMACTSTLLPAGPAGGGEGVDQAWSSRLRSGGCFLEVELQRLWSRRFWYPRETFVAGCVVHDSYTQRIAGKKRKR